MHNFRAPPAQALLGSVSGAIASTLTRGATRVICFYCAASIYDFPGNIETTTSDHQDLDRDPYDHGRKVVCDCSPGGASQLDSRLATGDRPGGR